MNTEEIGNPDRALTPEEQRYIERAQNDAFADGGIVRYYEQALKKNVHPAVLRAIEVRMWADFPRDARKLFGTKKEQAQEMLARLRGAVMARFDISGNGLRNHVKIGGDEKGGTDNPCYLYRYVSYRGKGQEYGAQLALIQQSPVGELQVMVRYYGVGRDRPKTDEQTLFAIGDIDQAQKMYLDLLDQLAVPRCAQAA